MIENEIKALRVSIEEHTSAYVTATNRFADAVNNFSEKVDLLLQQDSGPVAASIHAEEPPVEDLPVEEKPKAKPAKKKTAAKKKAPKKAAPKNDEPPVTVADIRKMLVAAVTAGKGPEVQKATKPILGDVNLSDLPANDGKLLKLRTVVQELLDA